MTKDQFGLAQFSSIIDSCCAILMFALDKQACGG